MENVRLHTDDFRNILRDELRKICSERNWNFDNSAHRGYAFQLWFARLICEYDQGIETVADDGVMTSNDLKADIVLEDATNKHLYIVQCKFTSLSDGGNISEEEVNDLCHRHELFMDRDYIKHGSSAIQEMLGDYKDKIADNYSVDYYFVSTAKASERIFDAVDSANTHYVDEGVNVKCQVMDFSRLKEYYVRSHSLEASIPREVSIMLPQGKWIEKMEPMKSVAAIIKGATLKDLYKQHKESLFAFNVRGFLGNRGINQDIIQTAHNRPEMFYYFNNGVSAICTDYIIEGNKLTAYNFQVINGAQTVGALFKAPYDPAIEVLVRITKAKAVATDKAENAEIIRYNNTQNVIKVSDFRSNDPIHLFLERQFKDLRPTEVLPKIQYQRKRSAKKVGPGIRALKLEDLAKIRYAFLIDPTLVNAAPKDLWTTSADGGVYEKAFGVNEQVPEVWSAKTFDETLLALALYFQIERVAREKARSKNTYFLLRLRYHILSLAAVYIAYQEDNLDHKKLIREAAYFQQFWKQFWNEAAMLVVDFYNVGIEQTTLHALVRSAERWRAMKEKFITYLKIAS